MGRQEHKQIVSQCKSVTLTSLSFNKIWVTVGGASIANIVTVFLMFTLITWLGWRIKVL